MSGVYLRPPSVVYEAGAQGNPEPLPESLQALIDKKTIHVFSYTWIGNARDRVGPVERHMQKIVLSVYERLPYDPIRRGAFLELLKLQNLADANKALAIQGDPKNTQRLQRNYEMDQQALVKLIELNEPHARLPAILNPSETGILKSLYPFWHDARGNEGLNLARMNALFIDEETKGYTPCRRVRTYRSPKPEDIQTLMLNWYYELPAEKYPSTEAHPSLDLRSLYIAMRDGLDWNKLAGLLMNQSQVKALPTLGSAQSSGG